jgi:hypothetical protein
MGTQQGGNGGNPPDGDRPPDPELPELPPEWGEITIPDDLSELTAESEQIQRELAEERRTRDHPATPARGGEPSIGVPLLIMSVAVLITLISLFAMTWSGTGSVTPTSTDGGVPTELPPVTLTDAAGRQVSLLAEAPAAVMLVEECDCAALIVDTVDAAPSGVTVVAVGHAAPPVPPGLAPGSAAPRLLGDPSGLLRAQLGLGPPTDAATVVLVDGDGQITRTFRVATAVAQYRSDLTDLGSSI